MGLVKVRCLLACLRNYLETRSAVFTDAPQTRPSLPAKITTPMDLSIAAIAVFRVFVTVGLASLFWIATAWPAGDTFLIWVGMPVGQILSDGPIRIIQSDHPAGKRMRRRRGGANRLIN